MRKMNFTLFTLTVLLLAAGLALGGCDKQLPTSSQENGNVSKSENLNDNQNLNTNTELNQNTNTESSANLNIDTEINALDKELNSAASGDFDPNSLPAKSSDF
jgi:ABC-type oligopeptide transport system substrate-binding subunit